MRAEPHRSWNKAEIVRAIQSRRRNGLSIRYNSVLTHDSGLICAARVYFGARHSWRKALCAAGFDTKMIREENRRARLEATYQLTSDELHKLFIDPANRFSEIAKQLGVTRERVRQIYRDLFSQRLSYQNGRQRWSAHTQARIKQRLNELVATPRDRYLLHISRVAKRAGLDVQFIPQKIARLSASSGGLLRHRVMLNGKMCVISHGTFIIGGRLVPFPSYIVSSAAFKICIAHINSKQFYFVIPASELRKAGSTIYLPVGYLKHRAGKQKIDWWQFKDAWHLLKSK